MTELTFDRAKWSQDKDGLWLSIRCKEIGSAKQFSDSVKPDKQYTAKLKEYRQKRSLDANAYFWVLLGKLADTLRIHSAELYRHYIKGIGDNFQIVPIRKDAKEQWQRNWESHGIGWICEELCDSKLDGYVNMICYFGSSTYDTAQMSRLIELLVFDCKDQGIETLTPQELAKMMEDWNEKTHQST